jgi:lysozyme
MSNLATNKTQIETWQLFLKNNGFTDVGNADGKWGPNTMAATKEFQANHNLDPSGIVDANTVVVAKTLGLIIPSSSFPPSGLLDVVFDISHSNEKVDFTKAKNAGMLAVFQKATQSYGSTMFHDPTYLDRKAEAKVVGLLWGAYHFGSGGSGKAQAQVFLDYAKPDGSTLLVLDFEPNTTRGETTMKVEEAAEFVEEIFNTTGKYPGIYSGSLLQEVSSSPAYKSLTKCWLWKAQYGPTVHIPPHWNDYTFWQYTDGKVGPSAEPVVGVGQCDRDVFKGTTEELFEFWKANAA